MNNQPNQPAGFGAQERAKLTEDLRDELYDLIHEHGRMAHLTVPEVIGVLEILKHELIQEQGEPDFDEEDDE